jgi:Protein of unknown function (DUF3300)
MRGTSPRRAPHAVLALGLALVAAGCSPSRDPAIAAPVPPPSAAESGPDSNLPPLDRLLAPIALYPDPLIALILPASTQPAEISEAAAALSGGDLGGPWSPSVEGLCHYPSVLVWLATYPSWTAQLGAAFARDPQAVMAAIQDLRHRALASGCLVSTSEQRVVVDNGEIEILPGSADEIYVPAYNPEFVYFPPPPGYGPLFRWGQPYPLGPWLSFYFDWPHHHFWRGDWRGAHRVERWRPPARVPPPRPEGRPGAPERMARPAGEPGRPHFRPPPRTDHPGTAERIARPPAHPGPPPHRRRMEPEPPRPQSFLHRAPPASAFRPPTRFGPPPGRRAPELRPPPPRLFRPQARRGGPGAHPPALRPVGRPDDRRDRPDGR